MRMSLVVLAAGIAALAAFDLPAAAGSNVQRARYTANINGGRSVMEATFEKLHDGTGPLLGFTAFVRGGGQTIDLSGNLYYQRDGSIQGYADATNYGTHERFRVKIIIGGSGRRLRLISNPLGRSPSTYDYTRSK